MTDVFAELPWLVPPDRWHPEAAALVEEGKALEAIDDDPTHGLEIWAWLGALTQAGVEAREKAAARLQECLPFDESVPGYPIVARCLVRLASSPLPGRYFAASELLELVSLARRRDLHRTLLAPAMVEEEIGAWTDPGLAPFRDEILRRLAHEAGPPSHSELMRFDDFQQRALVAERSI